MAQEVLSKVSLSVQVQVQAQGEEAGRRGPPEVVGRGKVLVVSERE